jgi:DNA repair exonuclease SbcCD nuclease subunit
MIIAIAADLHLNNSTYGKANKDGLPMKTVDALNAFVWIVDECLARRVDRFIVVGDVYDNHYPSNLVRKTFNQQVQRLTSEGIEVVLMAGNHDFCSDHHALMPTHGWNKDVKIVDKVVYESKEDFLAAYVPHTFEIEHREKTFRDYIAEVKAKLDGIDRSKKFILYGHFGVCGSMQNDSHQNTNPDDVTIPQLEALKPDAIFLGHYHKRQKLSDKADIYYVGSHERHDFSEANQEKGFAIYDTSDGSLEFVDNCNTRDMIEISGHSVEDLEEKLDGVNLDGKIVRVRCNGDKGESVLLKQHTNRLKKLLSNHGASHYVGIKTASFEEEGDGGEREVKPVKKLGVFLRDRIAEDFKEDETEKEALLVLLSEIEKEGEE